MDKQEILETISKIRASMKAYEEYKHSDDYDILDDVGPYYSDAWVKIVCDACEALITE